MHIRRGCVLTEDEASRKGQKALRAGLFPVGQDVHSLNSVSEVKTYEGWLSLGQSGGGAGQSEAMTATTPFYHYHA